jgi:hypothetical protein
MNFISYARTVNRVAALFCSESVILSLTIPSVQFFIYLFRTSSIPALSWTMCQYSWALHRALQPHTLCMKRAVRREHSCTFWLLSQRKVRGMSVTCRQLIANYASSLRLSQPVMSPFCSWCRMLCSTTYLKTSRPIDTALRTDQRMSTAFSVGNRFESLESFYIIQLQFLICITPFPLPCRIFWYHCILQSCKVYAFCVIVMIQRLMRCSN